MIWEIIILVFWCAIIILISFTFYYHNKHIFVIKELEKKFSQTGAYKNLKKMLAQKNEQIKELRAKLKEQQMEEGADAEEEEWKIII